VCADEVSDSFDLAIVPVSNYQPEAALQELAPKLGKAQFLIMSSNWNGADGVDRTLSRDRCMPGYPDGGGMFRDGGMIANLGPDIHPGEMDGSNSPRLQMLIDLFKKANMSPEVAENILRWLWLHNVTSVAVLAGFCKYRDMKRFMNDGALVRESFQAMKECMTSAGSRASTSISTTISAILSTPPG
jgi:ketopantoate reductase